MVWVALALLLFLSGIVSATETALFGLSPVALHEFGQSRGGLRRRVYRLLSAPGGPRRVLLTVLITNTTVNVTIFTVAFVALRQLGDTSALVAAAASLAVPVAVIVFGEMLPKAVTLVDPARFAPLAGALVAGLQVVLGPIQWLLAWTLVEPITRLVAPRAAPADTVTTDELKLLVEQSAGAGVINSTENEMLQAVVGLGEVSVREIMTPRVDIQWIPADSSRDDAARTIKASGRRRLPVCGRDLDDIRGILYARDLFLDIDAPVKSLVRRVHYVPEQVNLLQLLRHFREDRIHIAVVVDEFGGTAGLVTVEDVVEWIVGDLPEAETPRPTVPTERIDENTYRLSGDLSVRVWADRFKVGEIDRHVDTLAGLILSKLGRLPQPGDCVRLRNLTLTVETMRRRRIERVLLRHTVDTDGHERREGAA